MDNKLPAISVIIPLYNTEKYIGECLDSLLAQTFENFEVIVVDDCSTDSSCAIVESYIPKFGGRLKLSHMKANSGNAALPRNKGLVLSNGEYIYFMDSDDLLAKTGLEELYNLIKKYDADILYGEKHFEMNEDGTNVRLVNRLEGQTVEQPTFHSEDLAVRVDHLLKNDIWGPPWNELVRREVLLKNKIFFPEVRPGEDHFWILNLLFSAKKFLRVPTFPYFWRQTTTSMTRGQKTIQQHTTFWLTTAIMGLKYLDKMLSRIDFFKTNFQYHYAVLDYFVKRKFKLSFRASLQLPPVEVYKAIKQEFGGRLGEYDVLISTLCTILNTQQKISVINQQESNQCFAQAQARIAELEARLRQGGISMDNKLPAISVIIPMYNMEKYVAECLDSLLAQTFQDFEVIVVDDCSTDSSPSIVQSYIPKFGERLKLSHMKKNSGGAPAPRNRGIKISSGEYLYFMDSDDAIIPTALEELYALAKEFDADVIHCEKYYVAPGETVTTDKNLLTVRARKADNFTKAPFRETNDLGERIQRFIKPEIWWAPWAHFIKRNFILENDIEFPKLSIADDFIFTFCVYCLAENFVIVPNTVYVWRQLRNSNSNYLSDLSPEKRIHRRAGDIFRGIKFINEFTANLEAFKKNPSYSYSAIDFFIDRQLYPLLELYSQIPVASLDDLVRKELNEIGNDPAITAHLFGRMMTSNVNSIVESQMQNDRFDQLAAQAQGRIAQLEKVVRENQAYIAELENFIVAATKSN